MEIECLNKKLLFSKVKIEFEGKNIENLFSLKNNKSLRETILHKRYKRLENIVIEKYSNYLDLPLGNFLLELKLKNDNKYLLFLNKYGDAKYCRFFISDEEILTKKGIYIYLQNEKIMYIGRCLDNFKKRINYGYGQIYPKNCYIDGQTTNCHLNSVINENKKSIEFFVCILENDDVISTIEKELIYRMKPEWNIALK